MNPYIADRAPLDVAAIAAYTPEQRHAAIVQMYRDGATYDQISRALNVSHGAITKYARRAGLPPRPRRSSSSRPTVRCHRCGRTCRSPQAVCRDCYRLDRPTPEPVALTGGRWVQNGRGVLVWKWDEASAA